MRFKIFIVIAALLMGFSSEGVAQLAFDKTFTDVGFRISNPHTASSERGLVSKIERLSDGSYLTAGTAAGVTPGAMVMTVQKLNSDGSIDTSFGGGDGVFAFEPNQRGSGGNAMAVQNDGKIIVAGYSHLETHPGRENLKRETVVRLNPNGTLDTTYGIDGAQVQPHHNDNNVDMGTEALSVGILPDGRTVTGGTLYVGASSQEACHDQARRCSTLSIYDLNGAVTTRKNLDIGGYPEAREGIGDIDIQPDGRIVAGILGSFSLARFNVDGTLDVGFGTAGLIRNWDFFGRTACALASLKVQPDGKILATGRTTDVNQANGLITARFTSGGSLDSSYGTGGRTPVFAAQSGRMSTGSDSVTLPDGRVVFIGPPGKLIRFYSDGSPDTSFGTGGVLTIPGLEIPISLQLESKGRLSYGARTTLLEPGQGPVDEWFVGRLRSDGQRFDFDGDQRTDVSVYRPGPGEWWYLQSSDGGNGAFQFGTTSDIPVPADYTGDGKTDVAFWREATSEWFILRSEDQSFFSFPFGASGDIAAPGDFDGDGVADSAVFRPSTATWYINQSTEGVRIEAFGATGDRPVIDDYDGDGKDDVGVYRPNGSEWWINRSRDGLMAIQFGAPGDSTVVGDYTGDGKADIAFWRPATGYWFVLRSEDLSFFSFPFGANGDIPASGDYDGDGQFDPTVFRPATNTWFSSQTSAGVQVTAFGANGDIPLPGIYSVP